MNDTRLWPNMSAKEPLPQPGRVWHPGASSDDWPPSGHCVLGFWMQYQIVKKCWYWLEDISGGHGWEYDDLWQDAETGNEVTVPDWWCELGPPPPGQTWKHYE